MAVHGAQLQLDRLDRQLRQAVTHHRRVGSGIQQRGEQHISGDPVARINPQCLHRLLRRAIRAAATPAPKPLSTFTVNTPGAQLFSTASHAVNPSRCQP